MAKFEVRGEGQSLSHSDITPGFEHHHRDRSSGKTISNDQFGDDIETDLLVGNGLDHSDRNNIKEGDNEGKHEPLNREFCWPSSDDDNSECKH